jgi:hypothetical protein
MAIIQGLNFQDFAFSSSGNNACLAADVVFEARRLGYQHTNPPLTWDFEGNILSSDFQTWVSSLSAAIAVIFPLYFVMPPHLHIHCRRIPSTQQNTWTMIILQRKPTYRASKRVLIGGNTLTATSGI